MTDAGRSLRVGLFLAEPPPTVGGGFTIQAEVLDALARLRGASRHELLTIGWGGPHPAPTGVAPLPHVRLPLPVRAIRAVRIRAARGLRRLGLEAAPAELDDPGAALALARERIDLVWYPTPLRCLSLDVPFVTIVWDLEHRRQPWFPEVGSGGQWAERDRSYAALLRRASCVVVGTEAGRAQVERFYGVDPRRVAILPHPTPRFALEAPARAPDATLARLGLAPGYLLYPAQLWPHKSHVTLLHALRRLHDGPGPRPRLVLVGSDKGNRAHVEAEARRLGLADAVALPGFVSIDELVDLYRGAAALVYVTAFGPENLPPLEAFALGCPVVATRVEGAEEQLGDAAALVEPGDRAGLAGALASLLADEPRRRELARRGLERARRFTGDDFARGLFRIFDDFARVRAEWA